MTSSCRRSRSASGPRYTVLRCGGVTGVGAFAPLPSSRSSSAATRPCTAATMPGRRRRQRRFRHSRDRSRRDGRRLVVVAAGAAGCGRGHGHAASPTATRVAASDTGRPGRDGRRLAPWRPGCSRRPSRCRRRGRRSGRSRRRAGAAGSWQLAASVRAAVGAGVGRLAAAPPGSGRLQLGQQFCPDVATSRSDLVGGVLRLEVQRDRHVLARDVEIRARRMTRRRERRIARVGAEDVARHAVARPTSAASSRRPSCRGRATPAYEPLV